MMYDNVICQVPAPKLVDEGYILPPKVEVYKTRLMRKDEIFADYLVAKDIPFREAYQLVGRIVKSSLEEGILLKDIPLETKGKP